MSIRKFIVTAALSVTGVVGATAAQAADIHWSVGINLPTVGTVISNAPVYHAPPVVYAPAPVIVKPAPHVVHAPPHVVYKPAPRVVVAPPHRGPQHVHAHPVRHDRDHGRRGPAPRGHDHRR